jgi:tRNA(Ile)-lysidine synthase
MSARPLTPAAFDRLMKPLEPGARLALGVSGGRDSMALAVLMADWLRWREEKKLPAPQVFVLSVDHGLRKEAASEARQVGRWMRALGLAHRTLRWEGEKPSADIQAEARTARYRLMGEWAASRGIRDLLLAHHLEDQAETFLMRLQRGSGVAGLAAMKPVSEREGMRLLRPLLSVPRARLEAVLKAHDQAYIDDPSNEDAGFLRVKVRKALPLLEELGLGTERLVATARHMARAGEVLAAQKDELIARAVTRHPYGFCRIDRAAWGKPFEETGLSAFAQLLRAVSGSVYPPRLEALETAYHAFLRGKLGKGRTLHGCLIAEDKDAGAKGGAVILREFAAIAPDIAVLPGKQAVWDGRFVLKAEALRSGLEIGPLGQEGLKALKEAGMSLPSGPARKALMAGPMMRRAGRFFAAPLAGVRAKGAAGILCEPIWDAGLQMAPETES